MTTPVGFDVLSAAYPWPDAPPVPEAPRVGRNSSGFPLLERALAELGKEHPVIMEIGAEFGGSTRKFLSYPGTYVVSVDPWPDEYGGGSFPELRPFLGREKGMYRLFQTFNFEHRDRLVAVRERSPAGPIVVHDAGVEPDLIYIDGDHRYDAVVRDLTVATSLFPAAVVTGDDWLFDPRHKKYEGIRLPVQVAVKRFAAVSDMHIETDGDTWLVDPARKFNLDRPVPSFEGAGAKPSPSPSASTGTDDEVRERLRVLERSMAGVENSLKRVERSLTNLPSRRLARSVRGLGTRKD